MTVRLAPRCEPAGTWAALMSYEKPQCEKCKWQTVKLSFPLPGDPHLERCGTCLHTRTVPTPQSTDMGYG